MTMLGKIFITSTGYDPECGKHVKDPYLGPTPSLGACRPDVRRVVGPGDYIFTISGKLPVVPQFIMGGFQVDKKIHASQAFRTLPEQRLKEREDGQLDGNIIVNGRGQQHRLDRHRGFDRRLENYVVGRNPIALLAPAEIAIGREETLDVLGRVFGRGADSPFAFIGRGARSLSEKQVEMLVDWLALTKKRARAA